MRGRSQRVVEPKKPRESLNSSSIQKYLKEVSSGSPKSPAQESKHQGGKEKKKDSVENKGAQGGIPREDVKDLSIEEEDIMKSLPTKTELLDMFAKLENVIKSEILNVRTDMGHLLKQVEIVEEISEKQAREITDLKLQIRKLQIDQRDAR